MLKKLTPQFLKTLDRWLLKNQPMIWRTRIHWVLFGSVAAHLLVFVGYWLYPMSLSDLPSFRTKNLFLFSIAGFGVVGFVFWLLATIKIPIKNNRFSGFLLTAFLYWVGTFLIGTNLWMANKAFDQKVMNCVTFVEDIESDKSLLWEDIKQKYPESRLFDFEQLSLLKKYAVIPDQFELSAKIQLSESMVREHFGVSSSKLFNQAYTKNKVINSMVGGWFGVVEFTVNHELLQMGVIALIVLPLLLLFWSLGNYWELLVVAFSMFVTLVTINLFYSSSREFETALWCVSLLTIPLLFLVKNKGWLIWTVFFCIVLFSFNIYLEFLLESYGFCGNVMPRDFVAYEYIPLYETLMMAFLVAIGGYIYQTKKTNPQIN